jgi:hypothetical protein
MIQKEFSIATFRQHKEHIERNKDYQLMKSIRIVRKEFSMTAFRQHKELTHKFSFHASRSFERNRKYQLTRSIRNEKFELFVFQKLVTSFLTSTRYSRNDIRKRSFFKH